MNDSPNPQGRSPTAPAREHPRRYRLIASGLALAGAILCLLALFFPRTGPANPQGEMIRLLLTMPPVGMLALGLYFYPSAWAADKKHRHLLVIFLLNFFLGWTVLGWIGALIMAGTKSATADDADRR